VRGGPEVPSTTYGAPRPAASASARPRASRVMGMFYAGTDLISRTAGGTPTRIVAVSWPAVSASAAAACLAATMFRFYGPLSGPPEHQPGRCPALPESVVLAPSSNGQAPGTGGWRACPALLPPPDRPSATLLSTPTESVATSSAANLRFFAPAVLGAGTAVAASSTVVCQSGHEFNFRRQRVVGRTSRSVKALVLERRGSEDVVVGQGVGRFDPTIGRPPRPSIPRSQRRAPPASR
jgi:hypothetical protein